LERGEKKNPRAQGKKDLHRMITGQWEEEKGPSLVRTDWDDKNKRVQEKNNQNTRLKRKKKKTSTRQWIQR